MAESSKPSQSGSDALYDLSRYVVVYNKNSETHEDATMHIGKNAPYRILSKNNDEDDLSWYHVVIKYPNRNIAIVEANRLYGQQLHGKIGVDMVSHVLALLDKFERECKETLNGPTYVTIFNIPERISMTRWKALLSRFGTVVVEKTKCEGKPGILAKYESVAEAMAMRFALNCLDVDGKKLEISLRRGEKENYVSDNFRKRHKECSCVIIKCGQHVLACKIADERSARGDEGKIPNQPLLCCFCNFPEHHPFEEYDSEELKSEQANISWEDEFPELKEEALVVDNNWVLVDEEAAASPSSVDEKWEILDFTEFEED